MVGLTASPVMRPPTPGSPSGTHPPVPGVVGALGAEAGACAGAVVGVGEGAVVVGEGAVVVGEDAAGEVMIGVAVIGGGVVAAGVVDPGRDGFGAHVLPPARLRLAAVAPVFAAEHRGAGRFWCLARRTTAHGSDADLDSRRCAGWLTRRGATRRPRAWATAQIAATSATKLTHNTTRRGGDWRTPRSSAGHSDERRSLTSLDNY